MGLICNNEFKSPPNSEGEKSRNIYLGQMQYLGLVYIENSFKYLGFYSESRLEELGSKWKKNVDDGDKNKKQ